MADRRQELLDLLGEVSDDEGALAAIFAGLPDDSPLLKMRYADRDALIQALTWERDEVRRAGDPPCCRGRAFGLCTVLHLHLACIQFQPQLRLDRGVLLFADAVAGGAGAGARTAAGEANERGCKRGAGAGGTGAANLK